ncbi:MAG: right-handed parallel beta-helix repeat-containing protein [Bacteroidaceae bacterium]|nr:right-handed parallel beta-helix repeat-containing protein [Bacteroidaceae bacterium]
MKIKNLFFGMLAFAGMLAVASCSQDDFVGGETAGDYVDATFTVSTADGISTRATIGNGETVNKVACTIYDADGKEMDLYATVPVSNKKATYSVRLAKGQAYKAVFFAYNDNGDYYDVTDLKNVVVKGNQKCNLEERDAFTGTYEITAEASMNTINTEDILLKRPLAQLNLGIDATELADAANAGIVIEQSKIKVSNVYSAFNAYSNEVVGNPTEVVFEMNAIPTEALEVELNGTEGIQEDEKFTYLALNYLLVGDLNSEKTLTDVEFVWTAVDGKTNVPSTNFPNVRTQRNYRTNILGKLITNPATFNVVIDERFDENSDINMHYVANEFDLQKAIDAAPVGESTIYVAHDIVGNVTVVQKPGVKITIDGCGVKFNGAIKVHSNSEYYADAALTIKNLNFETSTASVNFIEALENGSERYSSNITVENCTFTAKDAAVNTAVGVQVKATRGVTVKNCTATNMHSLIQAQSCDTGDVKVVNCTVNGKNGVAFKQVKSATVEGTTINAAAYGIRFDGNIDNYGIVVKNNNVTAIQPLIVRKMTAQNNTIALEGNNSFTVSGTRAALDAYQVIITKGSDDEAYVKPTGTYTLTGADDLCVYPRDYYAPVASWDEFTAALAAGEGKIVLTENITYNANYQLQKDVILDLDGKSMTLPMINIHKNVTIKNGTINGKMYARTGCKATLEGLTFSGTISDDLSTEGHLQVQGGCDVYAKNCTFAATTVNGSQTRSLSIEGSSSGIRKFEGCDFKFASFLSTVGKYKKNVYINTMSGTTTVDFTNCKLNGKAPNIIFAAAYPLTNLTMSGCDNTGPTLETNRAKDAVTEADWAHISSLIANNKFAKVRLYYAGGSNEYIEK